jgi:tetratricopeptide (TPR) repeat protein
MRKPFPILASLWIAVGLHAFQPDPSAMRKLFEDALARRERAYGDADARTAQAGRDLGLFLCRSGDASAARRAMARAIQLDEKALGPDAAQTLEDVLTLASISSRTQAEPLLRRAAESTDPIVAGPALTSLAEMRRQAGDLASAAALLRRALGKAEAADEPNGLTVALVLEALAQVTPTKDAVPLLERAISIDAARLGPENASTIRDVRALSSLLRATGRPEEAVKLERQFKISPAH